MSTRWTEDELVDVALAWERFHELHPERTQDAYHSRRQSRRDGPAKLLPKPDTERLDRLWSLLTEIQSEAKKVEVTRELTIHQPETIAVAFLSDLHIGNYGTDHEALLRDIALIADTPGLYVYLGGDAIDNYILAKMLKATREMAVPVSIQWQLFEDVIARLENKVICVGDGNHTAWTNHLAGFDRVGEICAKWQTLYTGEGGLLNLHVGPQRYRIYRRHKYRFNSALNLGHSVKRLWEMGDVDFDIGVLEHLHVPHIETFVKHNRWRLAIRTGTYKVRDAYAFSGGFYGAAAIVPTVVLHKAEFNMTPFFGLADAARYLKVRGL